MIIENDPAKNAENVKKHGLAFEGVPFLDWDTAQYKIDSRKDYGETRFQTFIRDLEGKAYVVIFTTRGNVMRVISFRRAHEKERKLFNDT